MKITGVKPGIVRLEEVQSETAHQEESHLSAWAKDVTQHKNQCVQVKAKDQQDERLSNQDKEWEVENHLK